MSTIEFDLFADLAYASVTRKMPFLFFVGYF